MISESPATPRYPKYRSAGIEWLEEIPSHWDVSPLFLVSKENDARNHQQVESNVLSLSYGRIVRRDVSLHHGLLPESFETYQVLQPGDIVLRLTDLQNDKRSLRVGLVPEPGIITSAYVGLSLRDSLESRFAYYLLHSYDVTKVFYGLGGGVRQTMKFADLRRLPIVLPPAQEQHAIADFLDRETAKIDGLVASKERLVELLQEKRTALITSAVTRGLDPNVPMKDSGVEWLGEIPAHWEVVRSKALFRLRRDKARGGQQQLTASQRYGVIPQDEFMAREGRRVVQVVHRPEILKHVEPGDFVISMRSFQGGLELSHYRGNISSAYVMLEPRGPVHAPFFAHLFKSSAYVQALQSTSNYVRDGQVLRYENFAQVPLPVLDLSEQRAIARFLDQQTAKIDTLMAKVHQAINHLEEFRTALISAAVTGKIDVRGQAA